MDPDGVIMKWLWDFGDGTENISQNPTHIYEDDGVYLVSLTVFDDLGSSNSELYEISVDNVPPTAYFIHSPAKPLDIQEVDFRDSSTDPDGTIVAWTWTIDDSIRSNSSMFRYTFPDDGVYIIQLKVEDDDEYTSTYSSEITVQNVGPTAGFSFFTEQGNLTKNNPISFNDNSNDLDGSIVRWHWDFGDGQTSTDKNTKKTYSTDGVYLVTLSVEDDDGETESISKHVTIGSISTNEGFLAGLSIFDIFFVGAIIIAVIFVFFLSKKYAF
jgi:PKD repeat protein